MQELAKSSKVLVHCSQGKHRTAVAVSLLLRYIVERDDDIDSIMYSMRPCMSEAFHKKTKRRDLCAKAKRIFLDPVFVMAVNLP